MKTMKYFVWAAFALALGACTDENEFLDASKQITVEAGFGAFGRVATNGLSSIFEADDAIGVYVWTGGTTLPDAATGYVANNVTNTYNGTKWTATPQMFWKDAETPHYFLSVYPQTDILATTTYTLDATDQEKSDLLVATNFGKDNGGIVAQSNPVPLAFGHVMAKLRVNIKFNDEFTTAPTVEHVTVGAHATATIDWQTATATATGNATGIELPALATAAQGYACSYESVMVPQSGFKSVVMVIGGETYTFTSNQAMQLKKGTITTLNLTVGLSSIQAEDISILDWTTGASIDGYLNNISEQITAIKASLGDLEAMDTELNGYIETLQATATDLSNQITAANTLIDNVKQEMGNEIDAVEQSLLTQLETLKTTLEGKLADVLADIETLEVKDNELEGKITALRTYVDDELTKYGTQDWANATFATLVQYEAVQTTIAGINTTLAGINTAMTDLENRINAKIATDIQAAIAALPNYETQITTAVTELTSAYTAAIATAKGEIEAAYTAAIQTAIANLETSMKAWVNEEIAKAYYNKAEIDAELDALAADAAKYTDAAELQAAIETQQAALQTAIDNLQTAYNAAIAAAIQDNNGVIDGKIATAIEAAKAEFETSIATINAKITAIETRLDALEGDVAALKARIQSIRFLPEYSNGKVMIESGATSINLSFIVSPKAAAEAIADAHTDENPIVKAFIYHTKSRAVDAVPLTVTDVSGDVATGMLTVSVTPPAEAYWATGKTANIYIQINDGNNDIISEMIPAYYYDYVTFSAESEQTFSWAEPSGPRSVRTSRTTTNGTFEYSVGGGEWQALAEKQTASFGGTNGDLRLRGIAPEGTNGKIIAFGNETLVACSGDIRTLVDWGNYETADTKSANFYSLFENCTVLTSAPELPATILADDCYWSMFWGCTSLDVAPELPATTLANGCYVKMFGGCTSLNAAPELPATTLADDCYYGMFEDCTNLAAAPALPATTLAEYCYYGMFNGCTNLTSAPALPATTLAKYCYYDMFNGCTNLTTAPALPATTLTKYCYYGMFNGCTSLNSVTMLATDISANNCLTDWLKDVATTGTFTKAAGMTAIPIDSEDGIPTGWTVKEKSVELEQETLPGFNYVNGY